MSTAKSLKPVPPETAPAPRPLVAAGADPDLARECFERIRDLARSKDERVALAACREILDRLHGKPEQAHRLEAEGAGMVVVIREGRAGELGHE